MENSLSRLPLTRCLIAPDMASTDPPKLARRSSDGKIARRTTDGQLRKATASGSGCCCTHLCDPTPTTGVSNKLLFTLSYNRYLCKRAENGQPNVRTFADTHTDLITLTRPAGLPGGGFDAWRVNSPNERILYINLGYQCSSAGSLACNQTEFSMIITWLNNVPGVSPEGPYQAENDSPVPTDQRRTTPAGDWCATFQIQNWCTGAGVQNYDGRCTTTTASHYPWEYISTFELLSLHVAELNDDGSLKVGRPALAPTIALPPTGPQPCSGCNRSKSSNVVK